MTLSSENYNNFLILANTLIKFDIQNGKELKYEDIDTYIDKAIAISKIEIDSDNRSHIFHDIEHQYAVKHTIGSCIFNDYDDPHNWYDHATIADEYFWRRYRRYLVEQSSLDTKSIDLLDYDTLPKIMNCLSDPREEFEGKRLVRGLVIGDVQSGKTATYSGLICKAVDAGYKVVILLAGITENLRQQTQERIDEGIVGLAVKRDEITKQEIVNRVGVGLDNRDLKASSYTTQSLDFVGQKDSIITSLAAHSSVVLFIVKKNVSVLSKLHNWLKNNNYNTLKDCVDAPLLMIDDEADNASVNTSKDETNPTRTNAIIRNICYLFKNATYVGFTATPFANVFIDPDSVDQMKNADLFPEHFIYTLPTPSTYIGPKRIFHEASEYYRNIRYIIDIDEPDYTSDEWINCTKYDVDVLNAGPFYYRHNKEWRGSLPNSLTESIYCFFLANVIRDLRGDSSKPRSMLINMSRFVNPQNYIREAVQDIYDRSKSVVEKDFHHDSRRNYEIPLYKELERLWEKHYSFVSDVSFDRVVNKENLLKAISTIQIMVVNGSKGSGKLDYKKNPSLRVIAIGGMALSRGLTLEGLLISYFYRNTATFDVLMQMGRWFGYRRGYEDIFQIWTSQESARWYEEISMASEDLKNDIHEMFSQKLTPKDFGIKVRDHCEELQITAGNKMRNAFDLNIQFSYYGNIYETPYVSRNISHNAINLEQITWLTEELKNRGETFNNSKIGSSILVSNVPKELVATFISKIKCSKVNPNFNTETILDFINDENTVGIESWDIVFQGGNSELAFDIPYVEKVRCAERAIHLEHNAIVLSSRRKLLSTRAGAYGLTEEQINIVKEKCAEKWKDEGGNQKRDIPNKAYFEYLPDRKPLLVIMLSVPKKPENDECNKLVDYRSDLGDSKMVAFAIGFPGVMDAEKAKHYKANKIYYQLIMQDESEDIEYEESL